jgi:hypothetical protein
MRRTFIAVFALMLSVTILLASEPESIEQLKERAAAAKPGNQPKLFLEVAERQFLAATAAYHAGQPDNGKAAAEDVATYCEKAGAAARESRKYLKNTEIRIRDLSRKLDALRRDLSFDDREPVQAAIQRMEKVRTDLLNAMFGPKS